MHNYAEVDIFREDGTCDWEAVRKAYNKERVEERELWYALLEKNILSTRLEGNYNILRGGHLLGVLILEWLVILSLFKGKTQKHILIYFMTSTAVWTMVRRK
ncbi:MAG: hypothetical protein A3A97_04860 [Candidatus Terrybacteria bacterium RIFCSPLOWO2_01_FULL_40_23]|uniref:Uncharacterized protein n=1 Tax=Candidatus Terrybacteria bacterium RIFCSPLOWO2_01_FULL_40_23 TaxID=1802366 RepID=A0A1G2PV49_9BACT|nr:MAG: hypothetical protein A3A97_04860 [Candidatus Terrybacteria bacterium RIFCSPLOWO2_01_FULL_40_23]